MDDTDTVFCRLCAQPEFPSKVINLQSNMKKCNAICAKLNALSCNINLIESLHLPKTICFPCDISLKRAFDFIKKVKKSQTKLKSIFITSTSTFVQEKFNKDLIKEEKSTTDTSKPFRNTNINNFCENLKTDIQNSFADNKLNFIDINEEISNEIVYSNSDNDLNSNETSFRSSWNDYIWRCTHCDIQLESLVLLRDHLKQTHSRCYGFSCADCPMIYDKIGEFIKHIHVHRKYLRKLCHYCNESVEKSMKMHIRSHHRSPQTICNSCGEIFHNDDALKIHMTQYTNIVKPSHRKSNIDDLACKTCLKSFKSKNSLRDHQKVHDTNRKREYTCERCGKAFFTKYALHFHILTHEKKKPHGCKICGKSFVSLAKLRSHVNTHSGIKPFTCEECGRCFRLKEQLKSHTIIHTDKMPYKCDICGANFRFRQILKNHERQHTGVKPYSCEQCGMVFTNWANYNKHMVRKHKVDMAKRKITPDGVYLVHPGTGIDRAGECQTIYHDDFHML